MSTNGQSITWQHDRRRLGDLVPWEHNPRQIKKEQAARLLESLETFGQIHAIAVGPENQIYDGHQRDAVWAASNKYGPGYEIDVRVASRALTDKERAKLVVYLHKGTAGEFDFDALANLPEVDLADLTSWGFDESELVGFGGEEGGDADADVDPELAVELNKKWQVKTGDLWLIGKHSLICGDSRRDEDVIRLLVDARPFLMVTDPPYGVDYDPTWRKNAGVNKNKGKMGKVDNDDIIDWSPAWTLFPGNVAYVWHAPTFQPEASTSLKNAGFDIRSSIVWAKDRMVLSRGDYHWQHEACCYGVRTGETANRTDDRTQTTLWEIPARDDAGHGHGTQKPLECMMRPIRNHTFESVYDPFLGTGTTMAAAENLARRCYGLEINPGYCAVILERMTIAFPGIKIERQK